MLGHMFVSVHLQNNSNHSIVELRDELRRNSIWEPNGRDGEFWDRRRHADEVDVAVIMWDAECCRFAVVREKINCMPTKILEEYRYLVVAYGDVRRKPRRIDSDNFIRASAGTHEIAIAIRLIKYQLDLHEHQWELHRSGH